MEILKAAELEENNNKIPEKAEENEEKVEKEEMKKIMKL